MAVRFGILPRLFQPAPHRIRPTTANFTRYPVPVQRQMASSITVPPGKYEWLVIVPDKPGTAQKRLEVRP